MTAHNLPRQATNFIGRAEEVAEITRLLTQLECQLLTLVGAGGSGKTRLAIEVAGQNLNTFSHGIYFIPLAPLSSPDHIVPAIAQAMSLFIDAGEEPKQHLLNSLRSKHALLVMDNFEHVLDGATLVTEILDAAPDLKILATSREALNLQEEWVRHVAGMRFPDRQQEEDLEAYSAVQLFVSRAHQIRGNFALENERSAVIRICQLVEGMPLGIELAAAWLKTLSCAQIASEIQRGIDFLSTPLRNAPQRHRSMRAVFDHSWQLLTPDEQAAFRKMAIFRGGFDREAAEQVANASLRVLSALVDKSLLNITPIGRYNIHELLRQYGEEQLEATGERDSTQQAHGQYYSAFLQHREIDLKGRNQLAALNQIEDDFENVRVAWTWAVNQKNYDAIVYSLESLYLFCEMRTRLLEGYELLGLAFERLANVSAGISHPVWNRVVSH